MADDSGSPEASTPEAGGRGAEASAPLSGDEARRSRQLETILARAPDIIAQFDRELRHLYVNRQVEEATGLDAQTFIGRTNRDLGMPEQQVALWDEKLQHVFDTAEPVVFEFEFPRAREARIFEARLVPHIGPTGDVETVVSFARDVTERNQVERELAASRRQVARILESITEGFFAVDHEGRFTYVNQSAEQLLERERDELLGRDLWDMFPEAVSLSFFDQYQRAVDAEVSVDFEAYYPPLQKWFSVTIYPYEDGASVYFRDVSERRRLEREITRVGEEERQRIGQDLHDGLGALLTGISMMARGLAEVHQDGRQIHSDDLQQIADLASEGVEQARALARGPPIGRPARLRAPARCRSSTPVCAITFTGSLTRRSTMR